MLALTGPARTWEPRRLPLRLRLRHAAGQLVTTNTTRQPKEGDHSPWNLAHPERHLGHHPDQPSRKHTLVRRYPARPAT